MTFDLDSTYLSSFWIASASLILLFHFLLKHFEKLIPDFLRAAYLYGKQKIPKQLEQRTIFPVPKSWFTHFYAFGVVIHSMVFVSLCYHLKGETTIFTRKENFLKFIYYPSETLGDTNALPVVIVFVAEWLQMVRRLYECLFISSFSKGTMSLVHYFYGIFLYATFGVGLLSTVDVLNLEFTFTKLHWFTLPLAGLVFAFGSFFQHKTFKTFAALRKHEKEKKSKGHYIPKGHLFQWVSCPHFLCEIIIYLSFSIVFHFHNSFINFVLAFVFANQCSSALMAHEWYQDTFKDYPRERAAIIPLLRGREKPKNGIYPVANWSQ